MYWNFKDIVTGPEHPRFTASDGPIFVEIGCGNGEFLQYLSTLTYDSLAVGIEISRWCVSKAARRALANGLKNIRLLCGDARHLLRHAFERESVAGIFMNFPCPWPKRRHSGRRVTNDGFAELLASVLIPGGSFALSTDVDWYALGARDIFERCAAFEAGPVDLSGSRGAETKYGRKWLAMGRDIYTLRAVKTENAYRAPGIIYADESFDEMEISVDKKPKNLRERTFALKGDVVDGKEYKVVFLDVFEDDGKEALVRTISVDEGFEQRYYLKIAQKGDKLLVKTDSVGCPYKTPGVRASLKYAARKLASE
ncbi:MAG: tRNA (guanosine(46)-N7)-methyltransferase TrmB [Synergistaceae bacterium]|jgi:tRNA (guanine-N7-)-methyltransferase|nr:tRNA (guanosine(46)-N7)-methyltransferase TrmB [Synergistaceae bacterium]